MSHSHEKVSRPRTNVKAPLIQKAQIDVDEAKKLEQYSRAGVRYFNQAADKYTEKDYPSAIELLMKSVYSFKTVYETCHKFYSQTGQEYYLKKIKEFQTKLVKSYVILAQCYQKLEDYEKAMSHFATSILFSDFQQWCALSDEGRKGHSKIDNYIEMFVTNKFKLYKKEQQSHDSNGNRSHIVPHTCRSTLFDIFYNQSTKQQEQRNHQSSNLKYASNNPAIGYLSWMPIIEEEIKTYQAIEIHYQSPGTFYRDQMRIVDLVIKFVYSSDLQNPLNFVHRCKYLLWRTYLQACFSSTSSTTSPSAISTGDSLILEIDEYISKYDTFEHESLSSISILHILSSMRAICRVIVTLLSLNNQIFKHLKTSTSNSLWNQNVTELTPLATSPPLLHKYLHALIIPSTYNNMDTDFIPYLCNKSQSNQTNQTSISLRELINQTVQFFHSHKETPVNDTHSYETMQTDIEKVMIYHSELSEEHIQNDLYRLLLKSINQQYYDIIRAMFQASLYIGQSKLSKLCLDWMETMNEFSPNNNIKDFERHISNRLEMTKYYICVDGDLKNANESLNFTANLIGKKREELVGVSDKSFDVWEACNTSHQLAMCHYEIECGNAENAHKLLREILSDVCDEEPNMNHHIATKFGHQKRQKYHLLSLAYSLMATLYYQYRHDMYNALKYSLQALRWRWILLLHLSNQGNASTNNAVNLNDKTNNSFSRMVQIAWNSSTNIPLHSIIQQGECNMLESYELVLQSILQVGQIYEWRGSFMEAEHYYYQGLLFSAMTSNRSLWYNYVNCLAHLSIRLHHYQHAMLWLSYGFALEKKEVTRHPRDHLISVILMMQLVMMSRKDNSSSHFDSELVNGWIQEQLDKHKSFHHNADSFSIKSMVQAAYQMASMIPCTDVFVNCNLDATVDWIKSPFSLMCMQIMIRFMKYNDTQALQKKWIFQLLKTNNCPLTIKSILIGMYQQFKVPSLLMQMGLNVHLRHQKVQLLSKDNNNSEAISTPSKQWYQFNKIDVQNDDYQSSEEILANEMIQPLIQYLPSSWIICSMKLSYDFSKLILTRIEKTEVNTILTVTTQVPLFFPKAFVQQHLTKDHHYQDHVPSLQQYDFLKPSSIWSSFPQNGISNSEIESSLYRVLTEFDTVMMRNKESTQESTICQIKSNQDKREWWNKRFQIDERLKKVIQFMQSVVLGWSQGLLIPSQASHEQNQKPCISLRQIMSNHTMMEHLSCQLQDIHAFVKSKHLSMRADDSNREFIVKRDGKNIVSVEIGPMTVMLCTLDCFKESELLEWINLLLLQSSDKLQDAPDSQQKLVKTIFQKLQKANAHLSSLIRGESTTEVDALPTLNIEKSTNASSMSGSSISGSSSVGVTKTIQVTRRRKRLPAAPISKADSSVVPVKPTQHEQSVKITNTNEYKSHLILIMDQYLHRLPWESMDMLRYSSISRMPSLHFVLGTLMEHPSLLFASKTLPTASECKRMEETTMGEENDDDHPMLEALPPKDIEKVYYIVNPSGQFQRTQEMFEPWFKRENGWDGIMNQKPHFESDLALAFHNYDMFVYMDHGAGERYFRTDQIRSLSEQRPRCKLSLLMGCSSAALKDNGDFDPVGTIYHYILAGCPCIVGNLWDVTDVDIDRFSMKLLRQWFPNCSSQAHPLPPNNDTSTARTSSPHTAQISAVTSCQSLSRKSMQPLAITDCIQQARETCKLRYLNGCAPVCYGLPVYRSRVE